jgi:hypothetical protein
MGDLPAQPFGKLDDHSTIAGPRYLGEGAHQAQPFELFDGASVAVLKFA